MTEETTQFTHGLLVAAAALFITCGNVFGGWMQWDSGPGHNNHWYKVVDAGRFITWAEARDAAVTEGAQLACIGSDEENDFVFGLTDDPAYWRFTGAMSFGPWIGGTDGAVEGSWQWVTGEPWVYSNWGTSQPDNYGGDNPTEGEDYAQYWVVGDGRGPTWNDYSDKPYMTSYVIERAPKPQRVVLDWDHDAPVDFWCLPLLGCLPMQGWGHWPKVDEVSSDYREDVLDEVKRIFADAHIEHVTISEAVEGEPTDDATVVYFTRKPWSPTTYGLAYVGGNDRFNELPHGEALVVCTSNEVATWDAEVVAHEVGHTLGLRHVDPDPNSGWEVMDSNRCDIDGNPPARFVNACSSITDLCWLDCHHNPVYHLERYIDGTPDEVLREGGVHPGGWDLPREKILEMRLDFGATETTLYDVYLLVGFAEYEASHVLARFQQVTLSELSELSFTVEPGSVIQLVATSSPGGEIDTFLATGDPNDPASLMVEAIDGTAVASLQRMTEPGAGTFELISEVAISGTVIPEPATLSLLALGAIGLMRRRRG